MRMFTRRQSIATLVGGGVAAGALGLGLHVSDKADLIRLILGRVVGPFEMHVGDFSAFVADLNTGQGWAGGAKVAIFRAILSAGPDTLLSHIPWILRERFDMYERKVVTNFLTRTDYVQVDPREKNISFVGDAGCSSPFARFDRS